MSANAPHASAEAVFVERMELGGDGLRVGVKDSIDIAGHPTRQGSAALSEAPPAAGHAAVVQLLLDGGCRIVGKTNLHELAYGVTGINRTTGTPLNPRHPERIPGGSSSGSAVAVAEGLRGRPRVDFAIGTDTGGSIRIPAACCGVFGLKPTYGRVSRVGVHPAASSLDCVGPFARSLDMLERALSLMEPSFVPVPRPTAMRLGMVNLAADLSVVTAVRGTLQKAEIPTLAVDLPSLEQAYAAALTVISAENWAAYGHLVDAPGLGEDVRSRLLASRETSRDALRQAEECRVRFRAEVDAMLEHVDALVLPTLPQVPPRLAETGDARAVLRLTAFVRPFNLSGHPALTLPLETAAGLPAGLQLVGRRGGDAELCAVAHGITDHWA